MLPLIECKSGCGYGDIWICARCNDVAWVRKAFICRKIEGKVLTLDFFGLRFESYGLAA